MIRASLINCVEILHKEHLVTLYEKKKLIEGIKLNEKKAFATVSRKLEELAQAAYKEGCKESKEWTN